MFKVIKKLGLATASIHVQIIPYIWSSCKTSSGVGWQTGCRLTPCVVAPMDDELSLDLTESCYIREVSSQDLDPSLFTCDQFSFRARDRSIVANEVFFCLRHVTKLHPFGVLTKTHRTNSFVCRRDIAARINTL